MDTLNGCRYPTIVVSIGFTRHGETQRTPLWPVGYGEVTPSPTENHVDKKDTNNHSRRF